MTGPVTIEEHIVPTIRSAAAEAGRALPRVAVGLPVCVTDDAAAARAKAAEEFGMYGFLPSYRAMLDREGVEGPADVAIVGTAPRWRRPSAAWPTWGPPTSAVRRSAPGRDHGHARHAG